jgi:HAE1 family hydrophobic/amphiphilic exporter-1
LTEIKWLLGLSLQTVGMTMQTAYSNTDGKFRAGEYEYDINIKYSSFDRKVLMMSATLFL